MRLNNESDTSSQRLDDHNAIFPLSAKNRDTGSIAITSKCV